MGILTFLPPRANPGNRHILKHCEVKLNRIRYTHLLRRHFRQCIPKDRRPQHHFTARRTTKTYRTETRTTQTLVPHCLQGTHIRINGLKSTKSPLLQCKQLICVAILSLIHFYSTNVALHSPCAPVGGSNICTTSTL